jgi:acylphosphatase
MAEGESEAMRRFEMALRQGPPAARVDDVETEELPPSGRAGGFLIRG